MNLSLKHLVRIGTTAKALRIIAFGGQKPLIEMRTSDGFGFFVPVAGTGEDFPLEGKAIHYMKWIRKGLADIAAEELESEAFQIEWEMATPSRH